MSKSDYDFLTESISNLVVTEGKLKMLPAHYDEMKSRLSGLADKIPAHREFVQKEGKAKDIEKRVRWDAFHAIKMMKDHNLYDSGINDDHIDSALKTAFKELKLSK